MTNDTDIWRAEYAQSLYLREAHDTLLEARYRDLIQNLWTTGEAGNIVAIRQMDRRKHFLRLIFHVLLERERRGAELPDKISERALRDEATARYTPPTLRVPVTGHPGGYAKFGKRDHIRASFDKGILRITPAGAYHGDPSLNVAQADQELQHYTVTPNETLLFKINAVDADGNEVEVTPKTSQLFRYMDVPDFYVWYCAYMYDARLFRDFEADAVLLVRDLDDFKKRLLVAVEAEKPGMDAADGQLRYYDSYTAQRGQLAPIFSKDHKYLYQNEYRFAWKVPRGVTLNPFFVELGPLHDVAEFYELV